MFLAELIAPLIAGSVLDLGGAGSVVAAAVVLLAALGGASAVFKANRAQATITILQQLTAALKEQNGQQQVQIDHQKATIEDQTRQIDDLKEMVQSRAAVEALAAAVARNHDEMLKRFDRLEVAK